MIFAFVLFITVRSAAAETPRRGGTLRLRVPADWNTLDPAIAYDGMSFPLSKLLFRGLLNYGDGSDLIPDQASDWSVSPDGKTYRFHLRPGMRFSHGRDVEAADYVFTFERVLDPKTGSPGQSLFLDIAGARDFAEGRASRVSGLTAPDPRTLVVELAAPAFAFRYVLAMPFASALPREIVVQHGANFQYHLTGSGPYRVAEWRRGVRWRFERNPFYGGADGLIDGLEIQIGGDAMLAAMMVERGEIDRCYPDTPTRLRFQRDARLRSWLHREPLVNTGYLFLNTDIPPFNDVRVRHAISHAIDRDRLIRLSAGQCIPAVGIVPAAMPWSNPQLPRYDFNPEMARALLRQAGLANGFQTKLAFVETLFLEKLFAQAIQRDLQAVGITVELEPLTEAAMMVKKRTRREVPCGLSVWYEDYPDPSTFLDTLLNGANLKEQNGNNFAFYNNPELNRRVEEAARIIDPERRVQLFQEAEIIAMRDAPWVPLYCEDLQVICHPRLRGDVPHPVWGPRYEQMWLAD